MTKFAVVTLLGEGRVSRGQPPYSKGLWYHCARYLLGASTCMHTVWETVIRICMLIKLY